MCISDFENYVDVFVKVFYILQRFTVPVYFVT